MKHVLAIAAGGALGSVLRFWLTHGVHAVAGHRFPYGTLVVNVAGCLAMGWLFVVLVERMADDGPLRTGLLVGILGGFTTFSAFSIETFQLLEQGHAVRALANIGASVVLCLGATWIGVVVGRTL